MPEKLNFKVENLGASTVCSPLNLNTKKGDEIYNYVDDSDRVLYHNTLREVGAFYRAKKRPPSFEMAGPRQKIYFDPSKTKAAIVTCGGLCPGLNDVIRAVVMELYYRYGARTLYGIRYGYHGFLPEDGHEPIMLTPEAVSNIHKTGGTILGSSRGGSDVPEIVNALERLNINILFTIGGDGTQRGAHEIADEARRRRLKIAVVGIPKTIDNDIMYVDRTFGFETAFSMAVDAIAAAHVEADGAYNGIGLVKLMGRHSGYIAANAALAMNDVNFVLIPEIDFALEGPNGFLRHLEDRLRERRHAVVCVAEGVGQNWIVRDRRNAKRDASGNLKLADIGIYLKDVISKHFKQRKIEFTLKYIDPSYMIRSAPAVPNDSVFCGQLGQNAVHAGMAGKTNILIGRWNGIFTHIPLSAVINKQNRISAESSLWWNVLESTGQPMVMKNK
jgi:6-phosphofructokinase 1